jgi:sugar phosphate isomerase/epimerase
MGSEFSMDRRKFLGVAAGTAGAAAIGTWAPGALSRPGGPNSPIVTSKSLGIQHFSVRDATDRVDKGTMGYLGGPITGFEFFNFNQTQFPAGDARRTPSLKQIRSWLDASGMKSFGTHTGGTNLSVPNNTRAALGTAHTLGHTMIGTAGDPAGNANTYDAWADAAEAFNNFGEMLAENGIRCFFHPEGTWWTFFNDPDHPELSRTHKIDFFAQNTDPRYVFFEIDTYHTYNNRAARPDPVDGSLWDAEKFIKSNWKRLVAWHIKDANRVVPTPTPPTSSYTQTKARPGFPLNGGVDAIYALEGDLGKGFPSDPDPNSIGFRRYFTETRANRAKGLKYHIIESDSGPGGAPDQGRSLRLAKISARNLLGLQ